MFVFTQQKTRLVERGFRDFYGITGSRFLPPNFHEERISDEIRSCFWAIIK